MELIPLGSVSSVLRDNIVVRIDNPARIPKLGSRVYSREGRKLVGVVSDIIGPTKEPYAVVRKNPGVSISVGEKLIYEAKRRAR